MQVSEVELLPPVMFGFEAGRSSIARDIQGPAASRDDQTIAKFNILVGGVTAVDGLRDPIPQ